MMTYTHKSEPYKKAAYARSFYLSHFVRPGLQIFSQYLLVKWLRNDGGSDKGGGGTDKHGAAAANNSRRTLARYTEPTAVTIY